MKKIFSVAIAVMILMSLFAGSASAAGNKKIVVGEPDHPGGFSLPFNTGAAKKYYTMMEMLYAKELLADSGLKAGDVISELTYDVMNTGTSIANWEIYLTEVKGPLSGDTKILSSDATKVMKSKPLDFSKSTLTIPLDNEYKYKGGDLLVIIKNTTLDGSATSTTYKYFAEKPELTSPNSYVTCWLSNSPEESSMYHDGGSNLIPFMTLTVKRGDVPKTGDTSPVLLMMGLALAAGSGFVYMNRRRKSY